MTAGGFGTPAPRARAAAAAPIDPLAERRSSLQWSHEECMALVQFHATRALVARSRGRIADTSSHLSAAIAHASRARGIAQLLGAL